MFTKFVKNKNGFIIIYADIEKPWLYYDNNVKKSYVEGLLKDVKNYFHTRFNIYFNFNVDDYEDLLKDSIIWPLTNPNRGMMNIIEYHQRIIPFIIIKSKKGKLNLGYILYKNLNELNNALEDYDILRGGELLCININDVYPLNKLLKKQDYILKKGFTRYIFNTSLRHIKYRLNRIFSIKKHKNRIFDEEYNIPPIRTYLSTLERKNKIYY